VFNNTKYGSYKQKSKKLNTITFGIESIFPHKDLKPLNPIGTAGQILYQAKNKDKIE